jgi:predicted ATP-dependent endonuclease of OLD family
MRLSKIILENIKSFKAYTEIDFSETINIFIGPNGGGKSNLMNTISWVLNSQFYRPFNYQIQNNRAVLQLHNYGENAPEPHWSSRDKPSFLRIEFEVTKEDIDGLREHWRNKDTFRKQFEELISWEGNQHFDKKKAIDDFEKGVIDPDAYGLQPGQKFRYKIIIIREFKISSTIVPIDGDDVEINDDTRNVYDAYLRYLTDTNIRKSLKEDRDITLPYILYSPNRESHDLTINMSGGGNIYDMATNYHNEMQNFVFNSRGTSQILSQIASYVIGAEFVSDIYDSGLEKAKLAFAKSDTFKKLNSELSVFGFKWDLAILNQWANVFQVVIAKVQEEGYFSPNQASSGERQLLNFVFGLSSESIENSLIIIDEPELNLHPRWQKLLLRFLLKIRAERNAQIVISTHSASFLDERTLPHVRRIYRKEQSSALTASHSEHGVNPVLLDAVKLLNAQQNERIFFTQKAVLVEGQSDFVIWQKLINILLEVFGVGEIIEIIEVLGSANFERYRAFLNLLEIDSFIVADQDYVMNIGDDAIKSVFKKFFKENRACQSILKTHSIDRLKLISALEEGLDSGDQTKVRAVLDYLKCRHISINTTDLSSDEEALFDKFRAEKADDGVFVLKKGALEAYYIAPNEDAGTLKKDTDKAIAFTSDDGAFLDWMCNGARLLKGETPTVRDKIMAEESAEFITIAMTIIGVPLTVDAAKKILQTVYRR